MMDDRYTVAKVYKRIRGKLIRSSAFYGLSLDRRNSVFDQSKFISDPWPGNIAVGKDLLNGIVNIDDQKFDVNIANILSSRTKAPLPILLYVMSFSWIRDVRAVGGNNARKYIKNMVSHFVESYRDTRKFWTQQWFGIEVTSERIIHWFMSYSFFAIGADDNFQRMVLSSICEQYSHISRMYYLETDPLTLIGIYRVMLFYSCFLKNKQMRDIKKSIERITKAAHEAINDSGMYMTMNPRSTFDILRILLETRFVAKSDEVDLFPQSLQDILAKIAATIRLLRLGDGTISKHFGEKIHKHLFIFQETSHIVDTALSLVDNSHLINKNSAYDRISNKTNIVIVSKVVSDIKSQFNDPKYPGINILNFEASLKTDKLINRADLAVKWRGHMIKVNEDIKLKTNTVYDDNKISYFGEIASFSSDFKFVLKRVIVLKTLSSNLFVSDTFSSLEASEIVARVALAREAALEKINSSSIYIIYNSQKYLFTGRHKLSVVVAPYPTILVHHKDNNQTECQIDWSIESLGTL
jgi:hypothetical protein